MEVPHLPIIRWSNEASQFLDDLIDEDIDYADLGMAIEHVFTRGVHGRISKTINLEGIDISTYKIQGYLDLPTIIVHFIERSGDMIDVLKVGFLH